jgi:hypothetical protein
VFLLAPTCKHWLTSSVSSEVVLQYPPEPQAAVHVNDNGDASLVHVIDQSIRDIAKEFRFTVEEVQEYYDKCGEMGRTRSRFERMRRELSKLADDNGD